MPGQSGTALSTAELQQMYQVTRVSDAESQVLQELEKHGLFPGVSVVVFGRPSGGSVHLRIGRQEQLLSPELCASIRCRRAEQESFTADQLRVGEEAVLLRIRAHSRSHFESLGLKAGQSVRRIGDELHCGEQKLNVEAERIGALIIAVE